MNAEELLAKGRADIAANGYELARRLAVWAMESHGRTKAGDEAHQYLHVLDALGRWKTAT